MLSKTFMDTRASSSPFLHHMNPEIWCVLGTFMALTLSTPAEIFAMWCTLPIHKVTRLFVINCREVKKTEVFV